jgi:hypothetical protein
MKENKQGKINYIRNKYRPKGEFYLDHSCDEWIIGNIKDAKKFVKDLQALIKQVEEQESND